jgi:hypothetical protein
MLWVRVFACWLLSAAILSVVLGPWIGIPVGLVMAIGYAFRITADLRRRPRTGDNPARTAPASPYIEESSAGAGHGPA